MPSHIVFNWCPVVLIVKPIAKIIAMIWKNVEF